MSRTLSLSEVRLPAWAMEVEPAAAPPPPAAYSPPSEPPGSEPPAWRRRLAVWPAAWRQRWGELANRFEDAGFGWKDAEGKAFEQVRNERAEGLEFELPEEIEVDPLVFQFATKPIPASREVWA